MTFCIVSHVNHTAKDGRYYGYGPYIKEMNIWLKYTDSVIVVAPLNDQKLDAIQLAYDHPNITFISVPHFSFTSFKNSWKALIAIPFIFIKILQAYRKADHLHLRCPGNMGLLGALAQLFFPKKVKTAKYAGNWDPNAKQPLTYKWQKALLANSFLTKRMQVLVYGDWPNQSKNIKSFFTASYPESEPWPAHNKTLSNPMQLIFVGSLVQGKNPLYAVKILEFISALGYNAKLNIYGEGILRGELTDYIIQNDLDQQVYLQGNVDAASLKAVYEQSHFLLLPSQSEGWPKVVAEAMFWGCIPAATAVSCVSNMLDHENRGIILSMDLNRDAEKIVVIWNNSSHYQQIRTHGIEWSRRYTTTAFEDAIKKLMQV